MPLRFFVLTALVLSTMTVSTAIAATGCTLVIRVNTGAVLFEEGDCDTRVTPASSFKLPLAVIGFDARILTSPDAPAVAYDPDKHVDWMENWKTTVTPSTWLRDSVVWYSWTITRPLGLEQIESYLARLNYGNQDMGGTVGMNNGLTHAWLSSTLAISPREQAAFLSKLVLRALPVKVSSQQLAIETTATYPFGDGQVAKGKTGTGASQDADGNRIADQQIGWFIGWTGTDTDPVVFVRLIRDTGPQETYAGNRARDGMLADLPSYLQRTD